MLVDQQTLGLLGAWRSGVQCGTKLVTRTAAVSLVIDVSHAPDDLTCDVVTSRVILPPRALS